MNVTKLVRPSLRCARVAYFTDMTSAAAGTIPLGVFCEIKTPHVHGLALKARGLLSPKESKSIAPIFRQHLTNPFNFLSAEFDAAWAKVDDGGALSFLTKKHAGALSILAPYQPVTESVGWWRGLLGEPEVDAMLGNAATAAFDQLMAEMPSWDGPTLTPTLRLQLAA